MSVHHTSEPSPLDPEALLPRFGRSEQHVSGYTEPGHEVYARLFTPLALPDGRQTSWASVAEEVGLSLHSEITWGEISGVVSGRSLDVHPTEGYLYQETVSRILSGLAPAGEISFDESLYALWEGYAGELDERLIADSIEIPSRETGFLRDGAFRLLRSTPSWALTRTVIQRVHFPAAFWSPDRHFVLAAPLYHDSYYLSASRALFDRLVAEGSELLEIDRETVLPSAEYWD